MPLRAILFDLDGTLVDSEPVHHRMWNQVLAPYGHSISDEDYRAHLSGVPAIQNAAWLIERHGLAAEPAALADAKNEAVRGHLQRERFPLMPGVPEALAAFDGLGLSLAVVTGARRAGALHALDGLGLTPRFKFVLGADDVPRNKPAPDGYLEALRRLGLKPEQAVAIEDTHHGLQAAADAGLRCLALPNAYSRHHDFTRATAVLGGMADARAWIAAAAAADAPRG